MRTITLLTSLVLLAVCAVPAWGADTLKVMTLNAWGAGSNAGLGVDQTVNLIRAADPDVIGLQEVRPESQSCEAEDCPPDPVSVAPLIAEALGFHLIEQLEDNEVLWANAILSRYPIVAATPGSLGARIDVKGREILIFNIHATDYPYQPFQLLGIPYGEAPFLSTPREAIDAAIQARSTALGLLKRDLEVAGEAQAVFITGDFNEPSFRDWTEAAVAAGVHPMAVEWPFTRAVEEMGFIDVYREAHPDPLARPGFTWSPNIRPGTTDDHPDRIDFIFARGETLQVLDAAIVGESGPFSDIVVEPYPSDHRAVIATVSY